MRSQRVLALAKNHLKRNVREPGSLFMILVFPVLLTLVFGFSFGSIGGTQSTTFKAGIVDMNSAGPYLSWSQSFVDNLNATKIFQIVTYANSEGAQTDLAQGKIQAAIVIPANFGEACNSYVAAPSDSSSWDNATIQLYIDSGSMLATQAIPPLVQQVLQATVYGSQSNAPLGPIQIGIPSLVEAARKTAFDYMTPGLFAFAAIFLTMIVGQSFTMDREQGLLKRINTTPTSPTEFIFSHVVSNMALAIIQVALVLAMAFAVGYRPLGGGAGLAMAFVMLTVFSLSCVGFGLITASLAKSTGGATGIAFLFIILQMFLGTFVTTGLSPGAMAIGKFVPSYYVTDALTSLFLRGAPVFSPTIVVDFAILAVVSVLVLFIGIFLFRNYGKS